jgi:hypothetical protein
MLLRPRSVFRHVFLPQRRPYALSTGTVSRMAMSMARARAMISLGLPYSCAVARRNRNFSLCLLERIPYLG